ncbi:MAG TPA: SRPBCC domain-containing protein [Acidimicrobiales bacterium]|jgi:uncharacterized protein YndB with AHSA1/START domain
MTVTPDTELGEMTLTRIWQAPAALLFEVMSTPEHLCHFWGPTGVTTPLANITVEPRPGGRFETIMVNDETGGEYPMRAQFVEFDPPNRLSWTEAGVEGGMLTTVTFTDLGDGRCETLTHQTNVPAHFLSPEAREGLESSFVKCDAYVATLV